MHYEVSWPGTLPYYDVSKRLTSSTALPYYDGCYHETPTYYDSEQPEKLHITISFYEGYLCIMKFPGLEHFLIMTCRRG